MVRILLSAILCVSVSAFAHDAGGKFDCEKGLLHFTDLRTFSFLKKLSDEVNAQFPESQFVRIGVDRGIVPLVASLQVDGHQAAYLPMRVNLPRILHDSDPESKVFEDTVRAYLPPESELKGKTLLLMIYEEDPTAFIPFAAQLEWYLSHHKVPVKGVQVEFVTSQHRVKWIREILAKSFSQPQFHNVRPLAMANEVRHWMRDLATRQIPSVGPYATVDIFSENVPALSKSERPGFAKLKSQLAKLPARVVEPGQ